MEDIDMRRDGNSAAGPLAEIFGFEMTTAQTICGGCGALTPIGSLLAYDTGMGIILRCSECDSALIRISRVRSEYWLDLRGTRIIRVPING